MANKKVTYKEPADYFSPGMRKVAEEWDKAHAKTGKQPASKSPKGKAPAASKKPAKPAGKKK